VEAVGIKLARPPQIVPDLGYPAGGDAHVGEALDPCSWIQDMSMTD
jgi:hypothetical protein